MNRLLRILNMDHHRIEHIVDGFKIGKNTLWLKLKGGKYRTYNLLDGVRYIVCDYNLPIDESSYNVTVTCDWIDGLHMKFRCSDYSIEGRMLTIHTDRCVIINLNNVKEYDIKHDETTNQIEQERITT